MKAVSMNNLWTYLRSYSAWHRVSLMDENRGS